MSFIQDYWWALWGSGAAIFILWLRLARRGGSEPLLRRILYVAKPQTDPRSRRFDGDLPLRMLWLVAGGIVLVLLATALLD